MGFGKSNIWGKYVHFIWEIALAFSIYSFYMILASYIYIYVYIYKDWQKTKRWCWFQLGYSMYNWTSIVATLFISAYIYIYIYIYISSCCAACMDFPDSLLLSVFIILRFWQIFWLHPVSVQSFCRWVLACTSMWRGP